jgi:mycoredoxin
MAAKASMPVTVYWRPGCPYCARLRQDLRALGLPAQEVDIWADPSAAAVVRGYAGGNETVPTVVIGATGT